ncbi:hypothetical protein [Achromobacter dolens]
MAVSLSSRRRPVHFRARQLPLIVFGLGLPGAVLAQSAPAEVHLPAVTVTGSD